MPVLQSRQNWQVSSILRSTASRSASTNGRSWKLDSTSSALSPRRSVASASTPPARTWPSPKSHASNVSRSPSPRRTNAPSSRPISGSLPPQRDRAAAPPALRLLAGEVESRLAPPAERHLAAPALHLAHDLRPVDWATRATRHQITHDHRAAVGHERRLEHCRVFGVAAARLEADRRLQLP